MTNVFIIILFVAVMALGVYLSYMTALQVEVNKYYDYIKYKTKFQFRKDPAITCNVIYRHNDFVFNSRLQLMVTYPSGHISPMVTTTGAFNELWEECQ